MDELMKTVYQALGFEPVSEQPGPRDVPYPLHCMHKDKCRGLSCCPRDPNCCD